jgi:aspartyl protease family protein
MAAVQSISELYFCRAVKNAMKQDSQQHDFITRTGSLMTYAAWLILLVIMYFAFEKLIAARFNPNQDVATVMNAGIAEVVLERNAYGHYVTSGTVNGRPVVFLLDTGATDVAIPDHLAETLGLERGPAIMVRTANGNVPAYRSYLESVGIGDMQRYDVNATILSNMHGNEILLGMSYLKHFELIQRGNTLTIRQS